MRVLFLSGWFPYPPDNGSKIRIFNIIKQLSERHEVALLTFGASADLADASSLAALQEYSSVLRVVPYRAFRPTGAKALAGLVSSQPRSLVDTFSPDMRVAVVDALRKQPCDLLVASQLGMVPYAMGTPEVPALLEELELSTLRDSTRQGRSAPHRFRALLTWLKLVAYLRRSLPRFAACTVVSEVERMNLRAVAPGYSNVKVIPNAVDCAKYHGDFGPVVSNSLVFSGALTYAANHDAVRYFLGEVYPAVRAAVSDVTFRVTGETAGVDLASLPHLSGVQYTGYFDDIRPSVARSWASVVPIHRGGGTRLKILESMALGTPVVSTSKGAEGLEVVDGENILIADEPYEFAQKVIELLRSPALRSQIGEGGRRLVASKYDWRVVGQQLDPLVDEVAGTRNGSARK